MSKLMKEKIMEVKDICNDLLKNAHAYDPQAEIVEIPKYIIKLLRNKILWLSRHDMTVAQLNSLKKEFGDDVEIVQIDETITDIADFCKKNNINEYDAVCAVLPTDKLAELRKHYDGRILTAVSERTRIGVNINPDTGKEEPVYQFVFKHWFEWKTLVVETKVIE